jgi:predicted RNA binding protein YcfA (HicA-like mRNA interferase family)
LGKLKILSGKEVCKILSSNGFVQVRQKDSHIVMQKRANNSTITVPVPNHSEIRIGTLQSIIRQSGISKEQFESK